MKNVMTETQITSTPWNFLPFSAQRLESHLNNLHRYMYAMIYQRDNNLLSSNEDKDCYELLFSRWNPDILPNEMESAFQR